MEATEAGGALERLKRELMAIAEEARARPAAALARCEALLKERPDLVPALCLAGSLHRRLGNLSRAASFIDAALARDPGASPALFEAAQLASMAGDWGRARRYSSQLAAKQPTSSDVWFNLGLASENLGRYDEAIDSYERALALPSQQPEEIRVRLAGVLAAAGREEEADKAYTKVLASDPQDPDARFGAGMLAMGRGDTAAAREAFRLAVELRPGFAEAWQQLLETRRIESPEDPDLASAERMLAAGELSPGDEERLHFGVAKAWDDLGDSQRAFEHFAQANRLKRARLPAFDRLACAAEFSALAESARDAMMPEGAETGDASAMPVFIVGLPRSGTTLVDQMLTAHPKAGGVGEKPWVDQALGGLAPADWRSLDPARVEAISDTALAALEKVGSDVVTNKFPAHFRHLGLILKALPAARFIHVTRDPLDNGLSIFCQDFPIGNLYANDLEDIAVYIRGYRQVMAAWQASLGPRVFEVRYESLLENPRQVVGEMLAFLGLPFDEACLDHTANERPVATLSRWQVRQPLYRSSIGRWRRYEAGLQPLIAALGEPDAP